MKKMKSYLFVITLMVLPSLIFAQDAKKKTDVIYIQTSAICDECKEKIETSLYKVKGVKKAELNSSDKKVMVEYAPSKVSPEQIKAAISKAGYDADDVLADPTAYEMLPKCCQKDAKAH